MSSAKTTLPNKVSFVVMNATPYGFYDDDKQPAGIVVDIAKLISARAGLEFDIYLVPTLRIYKELDNGTTDLSMLPTGDAIDNIADRVAVISRMSSVVSTLKSNNMPVHSLNDLAGKRVGYVGGINYHESFKVHKSLIKVPMLTTQTGIEMLLRERIDYLISSERTLAYQLTSKRISDSVKFAYELSSTETYLYVSKKSPSRDALMSLLPEVVAQLHSENKIEAILRRPKLSK
jgi:ABC-type amino acid transport substrate-binding protein